MPPPISVAEAANQTGIPKRTIQAAITNGQLKAHKLGGRTGAYLITQRDLDKWIAIRPPPR
jgi:excisionase family DNA binding protein